MAVKVKKGVFNERGQLKSLNLRQRHDTILRMIRQALGKLETEQAVYEQWVKDRESIGFTGNSVGAWLTSLSSPKLLLKEIHPKFIGVRRDGNFVSIDFDGVAVNLLVHGYSMINEVPLTDVAKHIVGGALAELEENPELVKLHQAEVEKSDYEEEAHLIILGLTALVAGADKGMGL